MAELLARSCPTLRRCGRVGIARDMLADLAVGLDGDDNDSIRARLHIASALAALGERDRVEPAFVAAHTKLTELRADARLDLVREMALALARTDPSRAIAGVSVLMETFPQISDSFATNTHFCVSVLHFLESCVLALASEDLSLSDWARQFVEQDEHLLHRRIHRDLAIAQ
jgi:hypothetical protein